MNLVLGTDISREFWRRVYPGNRSPGQAARFPLEARFACKRQDVVALAPAWVTRELVEAAGGRIDAFVKDPLLRRESRVHRACYLGGAVSDSAFFDLGGDVFVAAPWFVFLKLAKTLSLVELVAFSYELCGFYAFDSSQERGFRTRLVPLTNLREMTQSLRNAEGAPGQPKALKALEFAEERSASPMETAAHMLLSLPYRYGGYGLSGFSLNYEIRLNRQASRIAHKATCYADLCNSGKKLIVEFQGKRDHASVESYDADRARINGLKEMGFEVVELTSGQISDLQVFEAIALRLARISGKRIRNRDLGATPARIALRKELFSWNAASGHGMDEIRRFARNG